MATYIFLLSHLDLPCSENIWNTFCNFFFFRICKFEDGESSSRTPGTTRPSARRNCPGWFSWSPSSRSETWSWLLCPATPWLTTTVGPRWVSLRTNPSTWLHAFIYADKCNDSRPMPEITIEHRRKKTWKWHCASRLVFWKKGGTHFRRYLCVCVSSEKIPCRRFILLLLVYVKNHAKNHGVIKEHGRHVLIFQDILTCTKGLDEVPYPIIDDCSRDLAKKLGMVDPDEKTETGMPLTCRAVSFFTF